MMGSDQKILKYQDTKDDCFVPCIFWIPEPQVILIVHTIWLKNIAVLAFVCQRWSVTDSTMGNDHQSILGNPSLPTWMVDFYGINVGKYYQTTMDPSWECVFSNHLKQNSSLEWGRNFTKDNFSNWIKIVSSEYSANGKLVVWVYGIPLWKGLLLNGTPIRIPNHQPKSPIYHKLRYRISKKIYTPPWN